MSCRDDCCCCEPEPRRPDLRYDEYYTQIDDLQAQLNNAKEDLAHQTKQNSARYAALNFFKEQIAAHVFKRVKKSDATLTLDENEFVGLMNYMPPDRYGTVSFDSGSLGSGGGQRFVWLTYKGKSVNVECKESE